MYAKPRSDSSVLLNIVLCSEFATAKVQQNLRMCKKNRIFLCFFARRDIAEH